MYDYNIEYQAPLEKGNAPVTTYQDLKDPATFDKCLGKDECYADFLRFFKDEVAARGVPGALREYLLKGDERANEIFCRMYTG
jgi:oxidoreductase AflY